MDTVTTAQLVGSLGFPIACCIALFSYMTKQREEHKQEMEKMTEALNNNTLALNRLELKIGEDTNGRVE